MHAEAHLRINGLAGIDLPASTHKKASITGVVREGMEISGDNRTAVSVRPAAELAARPRLFSSLEAALPVAFVPDGRSQARAAIAFCADGPPPARDVLTAGGLPTLAIGSQARLGPAGQEAVLSDHEAVDQRVRGLSVPDRGSGFDLGSADGSEEVLASSRSGKPVWTAARGGEHPLHRVGSPLPELGPDQALRDLFVEDALAAIATVQFLRTACGTSAFQAPKPRAAFVFDDPNLRWRTYGYIDFKLLAEHAAAHRYHAAMAMIPLDGWHQHRSTVELFRTRPDVLSLALHGNNHIANELVRRMDHETAVAIAAQAMRRARRFEARYGLPMDRVMIPPHGMCSARIAHALGALGFDALCAIHPYPWTENPPADRPLAGWEPAEFASGCAVIPRIPFWAPFSEIALRAFLDHPLVLYGHHEDLSEGLDPLAETASRVNRLGDVEWLSLAGIAATNYSVKLEGSVARVRPYSHRLRVEVPPGVETLVIEQPRNADQELIGWSADGSNNVPFGSALRPGAGRTEICLNPDIGIRSDAVSSPSHRVWPIVRRAATETRDRLRPLIGAGSP
jgi:hypothetical protein